MVVVMGLYILNWDFIVGKIVFVYYKVNGKFLIKKELFILFFGWLLRVMGGILVDCKKRNNIIDYVLEVFGKYDKCFFVFILEGMCGYNLYWKKGFYYIV